MMRKISLLTCSLSLLTTLLFITGCAGLERKVKVEILPDIPYARDDGSGVPLLMDIVQGQKPKKLPRHAIVMVPGGNIPEGARKQEAQRKLAHALAQKGYVCFLIDYRMPLLDVPPEMEKKIPFTDRIRPAAMDVKKTLRQVRDHADGYQIDPDAIALLGDSAGSVIALAAGVSPPDAFIEEGETPVKVAAIINLWGTADYFPELFGTHTPPIMSVHGGQDYFIGYSLTPALNIDTLCKKHMIPHYFFPVPTAQHGAWQAVVDDRTVPELIDFFLTEVTGAP